MIRVNRIFRIIGLKWMLLFLMASCTTEQAEEAKSVKNKAVFVFDYNWDDTRDSIYTVLTGKIKIKIEGWGEAPLRFGINNNEDYTKRLEYYLNDAKDDVIVKINGERIPLVSFQFENNQNLTDFETIVFSCVIPKNTTGEMAVFYNDKVFGSGMEKFIINEKTIQ